MAPANSESWIMKTRRCLFGLSTLLLLLLAKQATCNGQPFVDVPVTNLQVGAFASPNVTNCRSMRLYDGKLYVRGKEHMYIQLANNAQFIASFPAVDIMLGKTMKKVYFVFNENTPDQGSNTYGTRIGQLCANDLGGSWQLSEFTSFLKVPLLCESQGSPPFLFSEATDITFSPDGIIYGTFTSKNMDFQMSAVCAFMLKDVQRAFHSRRFWKAGCLSDVQLVDVLSTGMQPGICAYPGMGGVTNATSKNLSTEFCKFMSKHSLVANTVHSSTLDASPSHGGTLLYKSQETFVKIAVHKTTALDGTAYDVVFVATGSGKIVKFVKIQGSNGESRELAQYKVSDTGISNLVISPVTSQLYVDTMVNIFQVPLSNCDVYPRSCPDCDPCRMCVLARDPMCGWDSSSKACVDVSFTTGSALQSVANSNAEICGQLTSSVVDKTVLVDSILILGKPIETPSVTVTWYKNVSNPVKLTGGPNYRLTKDGRLEFSPFTMDDYGSYLCEHSADGSVVSKIEIVPTDAPLAGSSSSTVILISVFAVALVVLIVVLLLYHYRERIFNKHGKDTALKANHHRTTTTACHWPKGPVSTSTAIQHINTTHLRPPLAVEVLKLVDADESR